MLQAEVSLVGIVAGAMLLAAILWDAFETTVLSRRVSRGTRLTTVFYRLTWPLCRRIARRIPSGNRRENFLTIYGPLSLLLLIALWAVGLVFGFALLQWGSLARGPVRQGDFLTELYMSGTTLFTLGLGDVTPHTPMARFFTVLECGIGLGFLALVIGYLPVLSQAFSARERTITLLDARAGSPPTSAELLRRHTGPGGTEALGELLRDWERWSAQLLESHVSFPVLAFYRSQHDNQSWVAAMTALLDSCALILSIMSSDATRQARLTFAMARHAVTDMCRVLNRPPSAPDPERLPRADLARLRKELATAGIALCTDDESDRRLDRFRAMYEPLVQALSTFLLMPLPPWLSPAPPHDNWMAQL